MFKKGKRFGPRKGHDFSGSEEKKAKLGILSEDVMSYYRNVSASLESGFDDDSSLKENFLTNVYTTLQDEGIQVSQNQTVSRILEMLFSHSEPRHMQELFCSFCGELTIVTFDRFASHVFQALTQYLPAIYEQDQENSKHTKQPGKLHASVTQLCKFMESHMRDVMTHTYASHVLRSLLEALGGVQVKEEVVRSRLSRTQRKDNESDRSGKTMGKMLARDFEASFETLKDKLLYLCNYEDHLSDPNYCPVLQTVVLILHKTSPAGYEELVNTILQKTCILPDNVELAADDVVNRLPDIVQNEVGSYLIELLISLASETQLRQLYDQIFKGKLIYFAVHPIANYVLQKLLSAVSDTQMMDELLSDISQYIEDILAVNHIGIVTKLAEACRRTGLGQDRLLKALQIAFHCHEPESRQIKLVPLLASMQTYEIFFHVQDSNADAAEQQKGESSSSLLRTTNIHGSLVLQQLLQFSQPKLVVSSLLNLTPVELVGLCCDKCGSHVVDIFFQSQTILDKHKHGFLKKLEGMFVNIACNRNGSRCLESIWKGSSLKQRIMMAEELSQSQERLEGDQWGRFLYRNFALFKFAQRRKEWMEIQGASTKRQQLLQDILQGNANKKKRNKAPRTAEGETQNQADQSNPDTNDRKNMKNHEEGTEVETSEQKKGKHSISLSEDKSQKKKKDRRKAQAESEVLKSDSGIEASPDAEDVSPSKKRKRKKDKKRVVRSAELQESPKMHELSTAQGADGKVKRKKRKIDETGGERADKIKIDKKEKKKRKANAEGEGTPNIESSEELLKSSKPEKVKKHKFEKKVKLKKMKIKH